ncbi:MAG: hypothetical protein KatS3mg108_3756 [Isosphaeraceae bacterium]|nr:MAG: hypothetical protein KatS3mg108_3756 [Isosphaeraceae bacterium]
MSRSRRAAVWPGAVWVLGWWVVVLGLATGPAAGQSTGASAMPRFDGSAVYTVDVEESERFRPLGERLREVSAGTDRRYYLVVVGSSGEGSQATRNYADGLFEQWSRAVGVDPLRSVLIVVAVKNRQVAVRAGAELQARYGLRGATLQRELVEPTFLPLARAGRLPEAAVALVEAIERWIVGREEERAGVSGALARRLEQVRRDADEALATANRLLGEARQELEEKRSLGFEVARDQEVVDRHGRGLPELARRVEREPREVLAESQRSQHELEQVLGRLRSLPARQVEARARLEGLEGRVQRVEDALDGARQEGLGISVLEQALKQELAARDEVRAMVARDPEGALARIAEVEAALEGLLARSRSLPEVRRQRERRAAEVERLRKELEGALARAERSGASVAAIRARYEPLRPRIESATRSEVEDEQAALEVLTGLVPQLEGELNQVRRAESRHRLLSRTLPLGAAAAVLSMLAVLGGTFWFLARQSRQRADRRVREFRRRATELMEKLDGVKERHRLLPVSDPDYTEPLEGATLERYTAVQEAIGRLWSRWLEAMDRLEQAQRILRKAPMFGVQTVREAERVVEDLKPLDEIERDVPVVSAELDLLGEAHEQARARKERIDDVLKQLDQKIDGLGGLGVKPGAYDAEAEAVARAMEEVKGRLASDPLTAAERWAEVAGRAERLLERVEKVRGLAERARRLEADGETLKEAVAKARGEGLRLDESGGNPDSAIEQAERARREAQAALDAGDPEMAGARLDESAKSLAEGAAILERVRQARRFVAAELKARREEQEALRAALESARGEAEALARGHALRAWREVADVVSWAEGVLERLPGRIAEAEAWGSEPAQRYLAARARLEDVGREQREVRTRLEALGRRRAELEAVRADVEAGLRDFQERLGELLKRVDERAAEVGQEARAGLRELVEASRRLARDAQAGRPDWPALQGQLAQAREELAIVGERVEGDIEAHGQLGREVARLRPRLEELGERLRREDKDRPPSNLRYRAAVEALARAEQEAARGSTDWPRLLGWVREAAEELDQAEALVQEDLRLARQAESELDSAERALRTARGFAVLGVTADTRAAAAQLEQARAALEGQDYEQAVQLATAAEQAARRALHAAEREAADRKYQIERQRRRRAAESAARRSGRLPEPGRLPMDAWVIGAGQIADAVLRGGWGRAERGGGIRIEIGGPGPLGPGMPRLPGAGDGGTAQSSWGGRGDTGTAQGGW